MIHNVWPHRSSVCFLCQKKVPTIKMLDCMGFVFRCFLQDHPICAPLRLCCCRTSQIAQHPEHIPTLNPSWNSEVLNQMDSAQIWNTWGRPGQPTDPLLCRNFFGFSSPNRAPSASDSPLQRPTLALVASFNGKLMENMGKYGKM